MLRYVYDSAYLTRQCWLYRISEWTALTPLALWDWWVLIQDITIQSSLENFYRFVIFTTLSLRVRVGPITLPLRCKWYRLAPRDLATLCQHTSLFNVGLGRRLLQAGATYLSGVANRTDHFYIEPVQMIERYLSLTMLIFVNLVTIQSSVTAYPCVEVPMVYGV